MKHLSPILLTILAFSLFDAAAQLPKQTEFGDGASIGVPSDWTIVEEVPEGLVFVANSPDGNMTTNVQEEKKSDYEEVDSLAEFYQISVDYYTEEVWSDLNAAAGKEGEINSVKAVFGTISPTLELSDGQKVLTKGFLMVFENANYFYTVTVISSVSRYERNEQALLNILRSFKAP